MHVEKAEIAVKRGVKCLKLEESSKYVGSTMRVALCTKAVVSKRALVLRVDRHQQGILSLLQDNSIGFEELYTKAEKKRICTQTNTLKNTHGQSK